MDGTIKRRVVDKGFGFLMGNDGVERFFHHTEVKNADWNVLKDGDQVTFQPQKHPKGDRAVDIYLQ